MTRARQVSARVRGRWVGRARDWWAARLGSEEGWATGMVLLLLPVMLLALGLVVDGGRAIAARSAALGVADEAARAAVDQLDQQDYRNGGSLRAVAPGAAQAAACGWVSTHHADAGCTAGVRAGGEVEVDVTIPYRPVLLSAFGVGTLTAHGTSRARPAIGDTTEITTP